VPNFDDINPENVPQCNIFPSATACWFDQSSFDPNDVSFNDEDYLTPNSVAEITPGWSDRIAPYLTATRLYFNSMPEAPKNWGQINPNHNDNHSDPMETSSTFWLLDITDWWCQHKETHSNYANLSNVACDIFSNIPHGVGVEARYSLGLDINGWRQSGTTGETLQEKVIVRQLAGGKKGISVGDRAAFDNMETENDLEFK